MRLPINIVNVSSVKVYKKGIIVLPAKVRGALNIAEGDTLLLRVENDAVILVPKRRAASIFGTLGFDVVKELREERRREVEREVRA